MHLSTRSVPARWLIALALPLMAVGCGDDPCDEYVAYVCDCHPDDPTFDCDEFRKTYEGANGDLQDECAIALDEQETADETEGHTCGESPEGGDSGA